MHMKTLISKKLAVVTAGIISATLMATSAQAASVTATASAEVKTPIAITAGAPLNYGNIAVGATGGTAVLTTADALTVTGDVSALTGVTPTSGAFSVSGSGASTYSITLPTTVSLTGPGPAMTVSALSHNAGATPALSLGAAAFKVGGTLTVGAAQTIGVYSGSYAVTVNYQ